MPCIGHAQLLPQYLTVEGRLYSTTTSQPINAKVNIQLEVVYHTSSLDCVLYSETQPNVDLSSTDLTAQGVFALKLGIGTVNVPYSTTSLEGVFGATGLAGQTETGTPCAPVAPIDAHRYLRIKSQLVTNTASWDTLTPDTEYTPVPSAMVADTLQGLSPSQFLLTNNSNGLSQGNVDWLFNPTNFPTLQSLIQGTDGKFISSTPTAAVDLNSQRLTNIAAPTTSSDAVNKNYADTELGGRALDLTGVGTGIGDHRTIVWDQSSGTWTTALAGTVSSITTGNGMIGTTIVGAGTIAVDTGTGANKILQLNSLAQIPALDGSLLMNVNATTLASRAVSSVAPSGGQLLTYNATTAQWEASGSLGITKLTGDVSASGPGSAAATIQPNAISAAKINNSGIAPNRLLITDAATGNTVGYAGCTIVGQVYLWTTSGWVCGTPADFLGNNNVSPGTYGSPTQVVQVTADAQGRITKMSNVNIAFPVVTVDGQTSDASGNIQLNAASITGLGSAAFQNYGTGANQLVQLDASAHIPTSLLPATSGTITSVIAGNAMIGGGTSGAVTLSADVGVLANKIVQFDTNAKYPGNDGSQITNVNANRIGTRAIANTLPGAGQVLGWNLLNADWEPINASTGSVTSVISGNGLVAGTIVSNGTITVDVGTAANKIVQFDSNSKYPGNDGSQISNVNANRIATRMVSTSAPAGGQVLAWNISNSDWEPTTASTGSVTSVVSGNGLIAGTIVNNGTIAVDTGTAANKIVQLDNNAKYPGNDGSQITNVNASKLATRAVANIAPSGGQVLAWNVTNSDWEPTVAALGSVTSVVSGTGLVAGTIANNGTINVDVGTAANKIVQFDTNSRFPANDGSQITNVNANKIATRSVANIAPAGPQVLTWNTSNSDWEPATPATGSVTSVVSGTGLVAGTIANSGTLNVDVGTAANKIVQFDASSRYPSNDGSQITNVNASKLATRSVANFAPTGSQVLTWNNSNSDWEPATPATGSVTSVVSGTGLVAGTIANNGTISVDVGTAANKIVQFDAGSRYPANDGSQIANLNAAKIGTRKISTSAPNANQVLAWNTFNADWEPTTASNGSVTAVVSGAGMVATTISGNGTLNVDVGTAANKIVQLDPSARLPSVDGSQLGNINSRYLQNNYVSNTAPTTTQVLTWDGLAWTPATPATGSVTSIVAGSGLKSGTITNLGTLNVDVGTAANKILQLNATAQIPAVDGSLLTNLNATNLAGRVVSTNTPTVGQILTYNSAGYWDAESGGAGFVNGGNGFGAAATLGLKDANILNIVTNNSLALSITPSGHASVNSDPPSVFLEFEGTSVFKTDAMQSASAYSNNIVGSQPTIPLGANPAWGASSSVSGYPTSGVIWLDNEAIQYTGISGGAFTGLTRNIYGNGTGQTHNPQTPIRYSVLTLLGQESPAFNVFHDGSIQSGTSTSGGFGSIAIGNLNDANDDADVALGAYNQISHYASYAIGVNNQVSKSYAGGLGYGNNVMGYAGAAFGNMNVVQYDYSFAIGNSLTTWAPGEVVVGSFNDPTTNYSANYHPLNTAFAVGTGQSTTLRSNAMVILNNGNVGISTNAPTNAMLEVNGNIMSESYAASPTALASIELRRGRGTLVSQNYLQDGDSLGALNFHDINTSNSAQILVTAAGNHSSSALGSKMQFFTTANGGAPSTTPRMVLDSTGYLGIGIGTTAPNSMFDLAGAFTEHAMSAPSVSGAGIGVIYFDTTQQKFLVSQNGSAYTPLLVGGTVTSVVAGTGIVASTITSVGTFNIDVGTAANKIVQLDSSARYPADDGSQITNVNASRLTGRPVSTAAPASAQVLAWNSANADWEPTTPTSGTVTSVISGTGLTIGTITNNGTINVDVGTAGNKIVQLNASAALPAVDGGNLTNVNTARIAAYKVSVSSPSNGQVLAYNTTNLDWELSAPSTGSVTQIIAGTGLIAGTITSIGTLKVDAGTAASKIVQFDSNSRYPANDGYPITNINAFRLQSNLISATAPTIGQALIWNGAAWAPATPTAGTLTNIVAGTGMVATTITSFGTLNVDVGTIANKIVKLTASAQYPANDGYLISNVNAMAIASFPINLSIPPTSGQTLYWNGSAWGAASVASLVGSTDARSLQSYTIATTAPSTGQGLVFNGAAWTPTNLAQGSIQSIVALSGSGISPTTITSFGTLNVDVGTIANKIVKLDSSARLPIVDGSQLTNINAYANGGNSFGANATLGLKDSYYLSLLTNNSAALTIANTGNVGIGTTLPVNKLDVYGGYIRSISDTTYSNPVGALLSESLSNSQYQGPQLDFRRGEGSIASQSTTLASGDALGIINFRDWNYVNAAQIASFTTEIHSGSTGGGNLTFSTIPNGGTNAALTTRMTIDQNGFIGVGTSTPTATLDVNGHIGASASAGPSISATTCSGSTSNITVSGNDTRGTITLTSGALQQGCTITMNFASPYNQPPVCVLTAVSGVNASSGSYLTQTPGIDSVSATALIIDMLWAGQTPATYYAKGPAKFNYICIQ